MTAILTATSILRRLLLTPVRAGVSILLGGLLTLAAVGGNFGGNSNASLVPDLVTGGLLLVVVPLISLIFAVGALGDLVDDETMVYFWLKPLPRWQLGVAAAFATWQFVVPISVLIAAAVALGGGDPEMLVPAAVACAMASVAYSSLFIGLGLRTTRSLLAGLVFVLIWEGFLAGISEGIATISIRRWSNALFAELAELRSTMAPASALSATVVMLTVVVVGMLLTARWLTTREVP
ncbi:MAG: ABC-2 type transport system permease protein [Glaciecola sp.]|jgi:ABC-2 type transport system permease protein